MKGQNQVTVLWKRPAGRMSGAASIVVGALACLAQLTRGSDRHDAQSRWKTVVVDTLILQRSATEAAATLGGGQPGQFALVFEGAGSQRLRFAIGLYGENGPAVTAYKGERASCSLRLYQTGRPSFSLTSEDPGEHVTLALPDGETCSLGVGAGKDSEALVLGAEKGGSSIVFAKDSRVRLRLSETARQTDATLFDAKNALRSVLILKDGSAPALNLLDGRLRPALGLTAEEAGAGMIRFSDPERAKSFILK